MRQNYNMLDDNSDRADNSNPDIDFNPPNDRYNRENSRSKGRPSKVESQSAHKQSTQMKSIYLQGLQSRNSRDGDIKPKTQKTQSKVNADELIRVLQNGRERRNQRRKRNNEQMALETTQAKLQQQSEFYKTRHENVESQNNIKSYVQTARQSTHTTALGTRAPTQQGDSELKIRKVLKEMKDEERRLSKLKEESEWKEIESLLTNKKQKNGRDLNIDKSLDSQTNSPMKQMENSKRRHELEAAKQLLTGKVAIIWIFVISQEMDIDDKSRIHRMYSGLADTPYIVPLCNRASEIKTFLEVPNSLFKIVADLDNFAEALKCKTNSKVVQFYVYNNKGERGIARALSYKAESRKVKGIFSSLRKIIDRAEQQIQNQVQLFQTKKGLAKKNNFKKFPSFIKLSGEDKTNATLYRANLYGAKNMQKTELRDRYSDFMNLVLEKYGSLPHEKPHISDYQKLDHFLEEVTMAQAREVIKFYVRESFYYQILNSMLRTMKTTQQFRPCIFPFYETYHAVKKFYAMDLKTSENTIAPMTLYRGTRLRTRDFNSLKPGVFIEMLGFMSTSKSLDRAKQFCDRDGFIFVINVPAITIVERLKKYDHGFVDINRHKLALKQFQAEQQVLFNALNVFKVTKILKEAGRHYIYLQYGPIYELLGKKKQQLNNDERDVLLNYQYCAHMLDGIEDQGDVYLLANQYEYSKQYYMQKLGQKKEEGKYLFKLANVQQLCGELDAANKNVKISLELQMKDLDVNDREKCLKVFSIHVKNAEINLDMEDYLNADEAITKAIELLGDEDEFEKAKKLRQRGEIKFKKGEIIEAEKDFLRSETIFKNLTNKASERKKSINRRFFFSFLTLLCSSMTSEQLDQQKQRQLKEVEQIERELKNLEETISQQLIKVNNSLRQVALYAEDKQKYEMCVKKARAYLLGVKQRKTNDVMEKAKLKALEATVQDYIELAESERLLMQAIQLVESTEAFNPNVGTYSQMLANLQKKQLEKYSNPKQLLTTRLEAGMAPIRYNEAEHNQIYNKCKKNFEKAINVLLYNHKTKHCPQVLTIKNQLGQLQFYESKYEQSEKIVKEAKETIIDGGHSQIARSSLLLSKISYARGELKNSFENIQESYQTLRLAIIKRQQPKYYNIFESNDLLLQIKLQRSKIYLKQLNHDLSLKDLESMRETIEKKIDHRDNHSLLADIYEIRAQNLIVSHGDFQSEFIRALKLREKQIGEYNLANAVTYCNFSKYLILIKEFNQAEKMLQKAVEIFACFSEEHPITWLVLYCTGLLKEKKHLYEQSIDYIQKSLQKAMKKYDKGHITVNKIRLQYAKALHRANRYEQAIKQFESLEIDLEDEINASQIRNTIMSEKDDEKISVKRFLYESLKQSYREMNKIDVSNLNSTTVGMDRCEQKISDLKRTYGIIDTKAE